MRGMTHLRSLTKRPRSSLGIPVHLDFDRFPNGFEGRKKKTRKEALKGLRPRIEGSIRELNSMKQERKKRRKKRKKRWGSIRRLESSRAQRLEGSRAQFQGSIRSLDSTTPTTARRNASPRFFAELLGNDRFCMRHASLTLSHKNVGCKSTLLKGEFFGLG